MADKLKASLLETKAMIEAMAMDTCDNLLGGLDPNASGAGGDQ